MKLIDQDIKVHCLMIEGFSDPSRISEFVDEVLEHEVDHVNGWLDGGVQTGDIVESSGFKEK